MEPSLSRQTVVGKITSIYGIKGWVKVLSYTEPMENLLKYERVIWLQGSVRRELVIEDGKLHGKGLIIKFKGFDEPESVRQLCGGLVSVDIGNFPALADGEYYWHQLEGIRVITIAGQELGAVDHLMETGANDVLVVRGTPTSLDQRERLLPYLPEQVVKNIDLDTGIMTVDWDPEF